MKIYPHFDEFQHCNLIGAGLVLAYLPTISNPINDVNTEAGKCISHDLLKYNFALPFNNNAVVIVTKLYSNVLDRERFILTGVHNSPFAAYGNAEMSMLDLIDHLKRHKGYYIIGNMGTMHRSVVPLFFEFASAFSSRSAEETKQNLRQFSHPEEIEVKNEAAIWGFNKINK